MKILLVNGNTTDIVTNRMVAEAQRNAAPGTEIVPATAAFGAAIVGTRTENAIASHAVVDAIARHQAGMDAILLGISYDTALDAAREIADVPVVGMTEAALLTGSMLGGRFGFLTFGQRAAPVYRELIHRYGFTDRLAVFEAIDLPQSAYLDPQEAAAAIEALVTPMALQGAEWIVIAGAAFAGLQHQIQPRVPVPLVDGIATGVLQAELLARLGAPKAKIGSYAAVPQRVLTGVSPDLVKRFGG